MSLVRCLCCGDVLYWNAGSFGPSPSLYRAMGLTVHDETSWVGHIAHYKLIFTVALNADPSWWSEITDGWTGRLILTTDAPYGAWAASTDYLNSKTGLTGITLSHTLGGTGAPTVEPDPLTVGVASFGVSGAERMTGGTALSNDPTLPGGTWLAHNKPGQTDFVISGDTSGVAFNTRFSQNLWNVPL